jgi:uridylate kinase
MKKNITNTVVISVGGSLIAPDVPDGKFLKTLVAFIYKEVRRGARFVIVTGGGKTARTYQNGLRDQRKVAQAELDWMGIFATELNAQLVRMSLGKIADPTIIKNPTLPLLFRKSVVVACGWKPGCSTDFDAVLLAKNVGATRIVNLSNIDYAYTRDPKKYNDAKPITSIEWKSFRELLPKEWAPGLSSPFDPIAARKAEALGMEVAIINGRRLPELRKYLIGKPFVGSLITAKLN